MKKRVLVADTLAFLRCGIRMFLNQQKDLEVCCEAEDVQSTLASLEQYGPDLLLVDIQLGHGDVIELIKAISARHLSTRILVYSILEDGIFVERALRAGAQGYLLKSEEQTEVLFAIRRVLEGEIYVSRRVAGALLNKLLHTTPHFASTPVDGLSDREFQVFRMLGAGMANRQIAEELHLSIKTIETYRENIKHKFGLHSAAELVRRAAEWGHDAANNGKHFCDSGQTRPHTNPE